MPKFLGMGDHIYSELADRYARASASDAPKALYDRPTILRLLGFDELAVPDERMRRPLNSSPVFL